MSDAAYLKQGGRAAGLVRRGRAADHHPAGGGAAAARAEAERRRGGGRGAVAAVHFNCGLDRRTYV